MMNFLDLDSDGLRRVVLESMLQSQEFTVVSLHEEVNKEVNVSRKAVASMTGYIGSRLGIYTSTKNRINAQNLCLKDEYADM